MSPPPSRLPLPPGRVIAHRGGAGEWPENTLPAFAAAVALGVGIELDVRRCASGELVVVHDADLRRLCGVDRRVDALGLEALRGLSLRAPAWAGPPLVIPTLSEVLEQVAGRVPVDIELKAERGTDTLAQAQALVATLAQRPGQDRVFVTSFSPWQLRALRPLLPQVGQGMLVADLRQEPSVRLHERMAVQHLWLRPWVRPDAVAVDHRLITPARLGRWRRQGLAVLAWTVNEPARARELVAWGVDAVITDQPAQVLDALGG